MKIDNAATREKQIARIISTKAGRDEDKCQAALAALTAAAISGEGNLLGLSVEAATQRATVGEISMALEEVFGRHVAKDSIVRGAYSKESLENTNAQGKLEYEQAMENVQAFSQREGRNPRILVAKMG